MEKREKSLIESLALSSIVIALSTFGTMMISVRAVTENRLLPETTFQMIVGVLSILTLGYGLLAIKRFHQ